MTEQDSRIGAHRLALRAPDRADAVRLAGLANDYAVCSMTTRMPYPYGLPDAHAFIDLAEGQDPARERTFVIDHADEGVVGAVGFHTGEDRALELGYWVGRPYWGRGLATEAALAALDWARTGWRRRMAVAGHFEDNLASARVLDKAGFLYTGVVQQRHSRARTHYARTRMMIWLA